MLHTVREHEWRDSSQSDMETLQHHTLDLGIMMINTGPYSTYGVLRDVLAMRQESCR